MKDFYSFWVKFISEVIKSKTANTDFAWNRTHHAKHPESECPPIVCSGWLSDGRRSSDATPVVWFCFETRLRQTPRRPSEHPVPVPNPSIKLACICFPVSFSVSFERSSSDGVLCVIHVSVSAVLWSFVVTTTVDVASARALRLPMVLNILWCRFWKCKQADADEYNMEVKPIRIDNNVLTGWK